MLALPAPLIRYDLLLVGNLPADPNVRFMEQKDESLSLVEGRLLAG